MTVNTLLATKTARLRIPTGIEGLDAHISGGIPENKVYMISGEAGTGKTIFCLQFVLAGIARGKCR